MTGGKKRTYNMGDKINWERVWQIVPKETPPEPEVSVGDYISNPIMALGYPGAYFYKGLSQLGDNPIEGIANIGYGLLGTPFVIGTEDIDQNVVTEQQLKTREEMLDNLKSSFIGLDPTYNRFATQGDWIDTRPPNIRDIALQQQQLGLINFDTNYNIPETPPKIDTFLGLPKRNPQAQVYETLKTLGVEDTEFGKMASNVLLPIKDAQGKIDSGIDELTEGISKGSGENILRGSAKIALGGLSGFFSSIPAVMGLNAAIEPLKGIGKEVDKSLGGNGKTGEKVAEVLAPFVFGKWIGIGSLAASELDSVLEDSKTLQELLPNPEDQMIARELISNVILLGTLYGGKKIDKKYIKPVLDKIFPKTKGKEPYNEDIEPKLLSYDKNIRYDNLIKEVDRLKKDVFNKKLSKEERLKAKEELAAKKRELDQLSEERIAQSDVKNIIDNTEVFKPKPKLLSYDKTTSERKLLIDKEASYENLIKEIDRLKKDAFDKKLSKKERSKAREKLATKKRELDQLSEERSRLYDERKTIDNTPLSYDELINEVNKLKDDIFNKDLPKGERLRAIKELKDKKRQLDQLSEERALGKPPIEKPIIETPKVEETPTKGKVVEEQLIPEIDFESVGIKPTKSGRYIIPGKKGFYSKENAIKEYERLKAETKVEPEKAQENNALVVYRGGEFGDNIFTTQRKELAEGYAAGEKPLQKIIIDKNDIEYYTSAKHKIYKEDVLNEYMDLLELEGDIGIDNNPIYQKYKNLIKQGKLNDAFKQYGLKPSIKNLFKFLEHQIHDYTTFDYRQLSFRDMDGVMPFIEYAVKNRTGKTIIARPYDMGGEGSWMRFLDDKNLLKEGDFEYIITDKSRIKTATKEQTKQRSKNDKENIEGIPSGIKEGETPVQAKPIKKGGGKEAETSGILQAQKEVTQEELSKPEVKSTIPPELEPLAQEAKKYKSAEEFIKELNPEDMSSIVRMNPSQKLSIFKSETNIENLEAGLEALRRGRENYLQAVKEKRARRDVDLMRWNKELVENAEEYLNTIKEQKLLKTAVSKDEMRLFYDENKYIPGLKMLTQRLSLSQKHQIFKDLFPKWKELNDKEFLRKEKLTKKEKRTREILDDILFNILWSEGIEAGYYTNYPEQFSYFYNQAVKGTKEVKPPIEKSEIVPKKIDELKKNATNDLNKLTSGFDPVAAINTIKLGAHYFKEGAKTFTEFSKRMLNELGDKVKPYLLNIWNEIKKISKDLAGIAVEKIGEFVESKYNPTRPLKIMPDNLGKREFSDYVKEAANKSREKIYKEFEEAAVNRKKITNRAKNVFSDVSSIRSIFKEALKPISSRAEAVSKEFFRNFRKFQFVFDVSLYKNTKILKDYIEKVRGAKLDMKTKARYDAALMNGWFDDAFEIARKHGLEKELRAYLDLENKLSSKIGIEQQENHFPRHVRDYKKFYEFIKKNFPDEYNNVLSKLIFEKELKVGKMTEEQRADYINKALRGYVPGIKLSEIGNAKKRIIPVLDGKLSEFYLTPEESAARHITDLTTQYEVKKYFGDGVDPMESVGHYIDNLIKEKKISLEDAIEIKKIMDARFNTKAPSKGINALLDIGIITILGQQTSTMTQLKDMAFSLYLAPREAPKAIIDILRGKQKIHITELGFDPFETITEIADPSLRHKFVRETLKTVGFSSVDFFGKEVLINSLYYKYRRLASKKEFNPEFVRRIERYFGKGEEKAKVISDLKAGRKTDSVAFLLYNELVGVQPISLGELPAGWLKGGNWRVAYFLKKFATRQLDFFLNETVRVAMDKTLPKEQRVQGIKNFMKLSASLLLVGATIDELRERLLSLITGKEPKPFTEKVIDNTISVFLLSRYDWKIAQRGGLTDVIGNKILPPLNFVEDPIIYDIPALLKNRAKVLRTTRNIPVIGRITYEYLKSKESGGGSLPGYGFKFDNYKSNYGR